MGEVGQQHVTRMSVAQPVAQQNEFPTPKPAPIPPQNSLCRPPPQRSTGFTGSTGCHRTPASGVFSKPLARPPAPASVPKKAWPQPSRAFGSPPCPSTHPILSALLWLPMLFYNTSAVSNHTLVPGRFPPRSSRLYTTRLP